MWKVAIAVIAGFGLAVLAGTGFRQQAVQDIGRYQIVQSPISLSGSYMLDTATGRVWEQVQIVDDVTGDNAPLYTTWRLCGRTDDDPLIEANMVIDSKKPNKSEARK